MKTVVMDRDFDFHVNHHVTVHYKAGGTYPDRPEAQVNAIVKEGAGRIVKGERDGDTLGQAGTRQRRAKS